MSKQNELLVDGTIPIDCAGVTAWSGNTDFELGPCQAEVLGFRATAKGKSPSVQVQCLIVGGHEKNKGRKMNIFFPANADFGKARMVFFVNTLAGPEGFRHGAPYMPALKGARFDANIVSREYPDTKNPAIIKTSFEFNFDTIRLVSKAPALQPNAAQNIMPA